MKNYPLNTVLEVICLTEVILYSLCVYKRFTNSYKCKGKALLKLLQSKNGLLVFAYQPTGRKAGVQHKFSDLATFLQTTSEF